MKHVHPEVTVNQAICLVYRLCPTHPKLLRHYQPSPLTSTLPKHQPLTDHEPPQPPVQHSLVHLNQLITHTMLHTPNSTYNPHPKPGKNDTQNLYLTIFLSTYTIETVLKHLSILSQGRRHHHTYLPHPTIPLHTIHLHKWEQTVQKSNNNPLSVAIIFHYIRHQSTNTLLTKPPPITSYQKSQPVLNSTIPRPSTNTLQHHSSYEPQ